MIGHLEKKVMNPTEGRDEDRDERSKSNPTNSNRLSEVVGKPSGISGKESTGKLRTRGITADRGT